MEDPRNPVPLPIFVRLGPGCPAMLLVLAPGIVLALIAAFALKWPWWGAVLIFVAVEVAIFGAMKAYDTQQSVTWVRRQRELEGRRPGGE